MLCSARRCPNDTTEDKREYRFAQGFICEGDSILYVGAGCGLFSELTKGSYTGLDLNPTAVDSARHQERTILPESVEDHAVSHIGEYIVITAFQVLSRSIFCILSVPR